jgi:DNA-directed RNA polymerase subunit RPC12/RpoP
MSDKKLKSLDDHNKAALAAYDPDPLVPNGIACPKCGAELFDMANICLTSMPPKTPVECKACGWRGSRY